MEKEKRVKLLSDTMFKYLFGYDKNIKFTEYLLECLFNLEIGSLKGKVIINNSLILNKDYYKEHGLEIDVRLTIKDFDGIDILVNLEPYTSYTIRSILKSFAYLAKLYVNQFETGDDFTNAKILYQFNLILGREKEDNHFSMMSQKEKKELFEKLDKMISDKLNRKHIFEYLELYLSDKKDYEEYGEKAKRLFAFLGTDSLNEAEELVKGDAVLLDMVKKAKNFVDTNDFSWIDENYRKSLLKEQEEAAISKGKSLGLAEGKSLGIVEGIAKGITKGIINVAKNMIKSNYSKNQIIEVTGLSEEELDKIK